MVAILDPSVFSRSIQNWLPILNHKAFFLIFIARKLNKGSLSSRSYASSCKFTSGVAVTSDYVIYSTGVLLSDNSLRILQDVCSYKGEFKECTGNLPLNICFVSFESLPSLLLATQRYKSSDPFFTLITFTFFIP